MLSERIKFPDGKLYRYTQAQSKAQARKACQLSARERKNTLVCREHICQTHFSIRYGEEEGNKDKCPVTF